MNITWKDAATTVIGLAVIGFSYLMALGYKMPLINSYRFATVVIMLLGIGMCALGSNQTNMQSNWSTFASVLGSIAIILILATFITGSKILFLALSTTVVILWLGTTFRHLMNW